MQLDKLTVVLRPRSGWEAVDLGVRMVQAWWRPLLAAALPVYLVVAGAVVLAVGYALESPAWAVLAIWWLKPLYDRVVLHVLAHAVFGELPDRRALVRALPRLLWRTGLLPALLLRPLPWLRLNLMRSFMLPVSQLEGLQGKPGRGRRRLLARQAGGAAAWLTYVMAHFELILLLAAVGLVELAVPDAVAERLQFTTFLYGSPDHLKLLVGLVFLALDVAIIAFVEPFYVACGFALYLKRRTDLEAWDVELALRRLAVAPPAARAGVAASVVALALACAAAVPGPVRAADTAPPAADAAARARAEIAVVLARPEFGAERSIGRLKYVGVSVEPSERSWIDELLRAVARVARFIGRGSAEVGRAVAWLALAVVVLLIGWVIYRQWRLRGRAPVRAAPPAEVAGLDIRPESLPEDVAAAALALARAGRTRACLSLLYRAALSVLAHRDHVGFARGDTEGDCMRRVRAGAPVRFDFFADLTALWQQAAYACRELPPAQLETLCRQWPVHFAVPR